MKLHNTQLQKVINEMQSQMMECENCEDVVNIAKMAENFPGAFKFDNSENWKIIAGVSLISVLSLYLSSFLPLDFMWLFKIIAAASFVGFVIVCLNISKIIRRAKLIATLSDRLYHLNLFFANHISPWTDDEQTVASRLSEFAEFKLGNYSRKIMAEHASTQTASIPFSVYEFQYVDKEVITRKVSDGKGGTKTQTEVVYHTNYRYGVMFKLDTFDSLHLRFSGTLAYPQIKYKPSSIEFNNMYDLGAREEFKMSKFLKPALVEKITLMAKDFGVFNIEINSEGYVCFGFLTNIVFGLKRNESLENPKLFVKSLENPLSFSRLHEFIELFDNIKRYSD